ncbi:MAG TPA: hypothetical protein DIT07_05375 [Sphingobacteriaceae bacterium]|nr:hypothetical protein [Sphingobacteriaceae bacterium]
MKTEKLVWGLILVSIGTILLLDNLGVIDFYWRVIWHYWPVVLILSGINMVFSRNHSKIGNIAAVLITCVILGFLVYSGLSYSNGDRWYNNDFGRPWHGNRTDQTFIESFPAGTGKAELNISGGMTSYKLEETTSNLMEAHVKGSSGIYSLQKTSRDSIEVLNFSMKKHHEGWNMDGDNDVSLKLNTAPLWNINLKMGAGETDFDLTPFKVQNLTFDGGAASFKVKLGEPETMTTVTIKSGVSEIDISIPQTVGCQIKIKSGLSSQDFHGFNKQADGTYTTDNFSSSSKKIIINLNGGLSDFEVKRY